MGTVTDRIAPQTAKTHPWISFGLDLRQADPTFWMLLGEARSKARHLALTPIPPRHAHALEALYLARGVNATTAIEGNTLSEQQVDQILQHRLTLPPSQQYLQREVENVARACEYVEQRVRDEGQFALSPQLLNELNGIILEGLEVEEGVVPGSLRTHSVVVGGVYRGSPARDCPALLTELCRWLADDTAWALGDQPRDRFAVAVLRSIVAHLYIAWIHPYGDGNGRLARLVEVGFLTAAGLPRSAVHLLSNHYNATRARYYQRLGDASREPYPLGAVRFCEYALEGLVDEMQRQLNYVGEFLLRVIWRDVVDEHFGRRPTKAGRRQIEVAVALSHHRDGVEMGAIRHLTPELAERYADSHQKTVTRDIGRLASFGLVEREGAVVRSTMLSYLGAFLPVAGPQAAATILD